MHFIELLFLLISYLPYCVDWPDLIVQNAAPAYRVHLLSVQGTSTYDKNQSRGILLGE